MTLDPDENAASDAFWRFSLALYARPGVAEALLSLQDRRGHDVNLMLYALWLGTHGRRAAAEEFAAAVAAVASLNDTVAVLRRQRRQLRDAGNPDLAALRQRLLRLELEGERLVQSRLAARLRTGFPAIIDCADGKTPIAAARLNLARYLGADARSSEAAILLLALEGLTRSS